MPTENNRLFVLSGIASFFLFSMLVVIIAWQANVFVKPIAYASIQSDVISISLDSSAPIDSKSENITSEEVPATEPVIEQKSKSQLPKVEKVEKVQPEITDLFSNVKVKHIPKESKQNTKELSELSALEEKVLSTKRSSQLFEKAKNLDLAKPGVKVIAASGGPKVNEYYAKVQGIIYANFHPATGTEGFAARVRIVLTPDGKLDSYRVISASGNAVFNAEVDWLKERLRQVALPKNPKGEEAIFEIILTAKD
ncbi:MAG: TonB C-terminal domain-containing protein [Pseudomonadota bacterium]